MSSSTGPQPGPLPPLVVGFDLDMTLIDARVGIRAAWLALSRETGVPVDADLVVTRLGPPVETEVANWFPPDDVERVAARYRAIYADVGATGVVAMPGAEQALAAVRAHHGASVAVTAKHEPNARLNVTHLGLDLDEVLGDLWAEAKGHALAQRGGSIYVGDHVHDVLGARTAGAAAVAVATGPCSRAELEAAGADVVLDSLVDFPIWLDAHLLDVRATSLLERLAALDSVMVAFSGGADSALLLAAAARALGPERVVAATAYSDSLPRSERGPAAEFASMLGVRLVTPDTHELARAGYRANGGDRCYFCKAELLDVLRPLADELGVAHVATGTNADDAVADFRPGIRAAAERGAVTPLREAGFTKAQVRELSRRWGLPTSDKPAAACLSSRIAYGIEVSPFRLARVERAEAALRETLRAAGIEITDLRVRDLDDRARVEVDATAVPAVRLCQPALDAVRAAGFDGVDIEVLAFRSGSMNSLLEPSPAPG